MAIVMSMSSQVFQDMLAMPQNASSPNAHQTVTLVEREETLKKFFAVMADDSTMQDLSLQDFATLLPLNDKYEVGHFRLAIVENILRNGRSDPLLGLALAVKIKDIRLAKTCIEALTHSYPIRREDRYVKPYDSACDEVSYLNSDAIRDIGKLEPGIALPLLAAFAKVFARSGGHTWKDVAHFIQLDMA